MPMLWRTKIICFKLSCQGLTYALIRETPSPSPNRGVQAGLVLLPSSLQQCLSVDTLVMVKQHPMHLQLPLWLQLPVMPNTNLEALVDSGVSGYFMDLELL